ncbi:hypothetical protein P154DRAFT_551246 [Amniculicola lignicola CBS 123094]|uniref:RBR-type E3 ubiquitin transferase n=1 Tax=Amniculicola lignicola CBS 123094 TaxID=1392246 RepID=A0A6A5WW36_9PLEO|nr:hypothetical protein P154DRAFT_551246 [Amniculicola lignicola CBS 123094]
MPMQAPHAGLLDDEITALALQLEEIGLFEENDKGKYRTDSPPDNKLACDDFETEIQDHLNFLRDLRLARSIADAVDSDAQAIADLASGEEQANDDLDVTWPLDDIEDGTEAGCSSSMTSEQKQHGAFGRFSRVYECCVCRESFRIPGILLLPCDHRYCMDCLRELFLHAIKDEALFPPRCCREPIPLRFISSSLSSSELKRFHEAKQEYSSDKRTYCSNNACGRFIHSVDILDDIAECAHCLTETCAICQRPAHSSFECPNDPTLQATLSLADEEGWQRCYSCRGMVELDVGCNHMTCKCGAQFCYACGERWKTCPCDQWHEERLVRRAEEVVHRENPQRLLAAEVVNAAVEEMRENLREEHQCTHPGWLDRVDYTGQPLQCEVCAHHFHSFILQCPRCHVQICASCRRNRLR